MVAKQLAAGPDDDVDMRTGRHLRLIAGMQLPGAGNESKGGQFIGILIRSVTEAKLDQH
jgi:hypothetical protein